MSMQLVITRGSISLIVFLSNVCLRVFKSTNWATSLVCTNGFLDCEFFLLVWATLAEEYSQALCKFKWKLSLDLGTTVILSKHNGSCQVRACETIIKNLCRWNVQSCRQTDIALFLHKYKRSSLLSRWPNHNEQTPLKPFAKAISIFSSSRPGNLEKKSQLHVVAQDVTTT